MYRELGVPQSAGKGAEKEIVEPEGWFRAVVFPGIVAFVLIQAVSGVCDKASESHKESRGERGEQRVDAFEM